MSEVVVGAGFGAYHVNADKCHHNTNEPHQCVHDWRIHWGNVEKTSSE